MRRDGTVPQEAPSGEVSDLYRALALLGIEIWLQARDVGV